MADAPCAACRRVILLHTGARYTPGAGASVSSAASAGIHRCRFTPALVFIFSMTAANAPIFLIAIRDKWAGHDVAPGLGAALAFGTHENAVRYAMRLAEKDKTPIALYRIVEYRFSGNVTEG